jgi:hypothetical protein
MTALYCEVPRDINPKCSAKNKGDVAFRGTDHKELKLGCLRGRQFLTLYLIVIWKQ